MTVSMTGVTVRFGSLTALENVDFEARPGHIHALVGENGAGKTTLMRVLFGSQRADSGEVTVDGAHVKSRRAAIGMVSQHYSVIPQLKNLQNLMVGAEPGAVLDRKRDRARAEGIARAMGFSFDWDAPSSSLSPAGAQKLEILKLLWRESQVMILDEPTAMLSPADSEELYTSLKRLAEEGRTAIVVTHRIREVLDHCERVTVLRGGKRVATLPVAETDEANLARLIIGHDLRERGSATAEPGPPILMIERLTVLGDRGHRAVDDASLVVRKGEVVGIAGVDGSGQRELFQALIGTRSATGSVRFGGIDWLNLTTAKRLASGLRLVPEDRHAEAVIEDWSLFENAALGLHRDPPFAHGHWIDTQGRARQAGVIADAFKTRYGSLAQPMKSLSGGNQQRFVAGRGLTTQPKLIAAFQPTRGLDIDGSAKIYQAIRHECRQGAVALVVGFDLDELLVECDRVVAMCQGRIFEAPGGLERDRDAIGRLMVGVG
ncbi:MAG: ATP-binding cassette domain-containing protein [Fimbriimonadaceae bacterium]|nr:ATP-binding cassette domain-containing protein [Fimbriimonadaceae bacterium]QYK58372.1 MAG: ATP-binding cassette domain-containing protein [Fimbriimonadaceae bacterium]